MEVIVYLGASMLPISVGGKEFDEQQAHEIYGSIVEPIGLAILIVCAGVLLTAALVSL